MQTSFLIETLDNCYDNCARIGGKCLTRAACGDGASTDQFCQDGLECCNKVPYESRCTTFGGECVKDCPKSILHLGARAKDCAEGLDCCIWLQ
ncbi:PREDICTED: uncharacterized protein LOC108564359 isoform X2 [Nicrophorus vespilloides]|uniref:Uncharacterized protein LOC108564359 isoform X2 n=1 Tax=Nicrophorus vespilloides TaxID=110193 RepID=A0ABM1MWC1_NICVS|nr:PREDICTED: uncharacterized protein LOC108564359 isoform X2 [Nicrophorus vespilloides]